MPAFGVVPFRFFLTPVEVLASFLKRASAKYKASYMLLAIDRNSRRRHLLARVHATVCPLEFQQPKADSILMLISTALARVPYPQPTLQKHLKSISMGSTNLAMVVICSQSAAPTLPSYDT